MVHEIPKGIRQDLGEAKQDCPLPPESEKIMQHVQSEKQEG